MKLDMIGLNVKDIKKALSFYEIIGLNISYGTKDDEYVEIGNESIRISLNQQKMLDELLEQKLQETSNKCELAFLCSNKDEVDLKIKKLKDKDVHVILEPFDAPWGQYYALVQDYDGHMISFFC